MMETTGAMITAALITWTVFGMICAVYRTRNYMEPSGNWQALLWLVEGGPIVLIMAAILLVLDWVESIKAACTRGK